MAADSLPTSRLVQKADACQLFHLIDGTNISLVEPSNKPAVEEALLMLGTSETEGLIYKAIISVEGREDVEVLEEGFPTLLQSFKIKPQGGKQEVLSGIKALKELEKDGDLQSSHYFIFDRDQKPTKETSSEKVKLLEWDRYCLENYLIDSNIIARLLKDKGIAKTAPRNPGEVKARLRTLAFRQIDDLALIRAFEDLKIPSANLELADIKGMNADDAWSTIDVRLSAIKNFISANNTNGLKSKFEGKVAERHKELNQLWNSDWVKHCNGKKLFSDCYAEFNLVIAPSKLKKRIVAEMRTSANNQNWKDWEKQIKTLIGV